MKEKLDSGHTIEKMKGEEAESLEKRFFLYVDGVIKLHPGNWTYMAPYARYANLIYNFEVRASDIYLITFPKSGTTWMQEILWTLVHNPDLDHPDAGVQIDERFPNIESDMYLAVTGAPRLDPKGNLMASFNKVSPGKHFLDGLYVDLSAHAPSPRMIKSHLSLTLLPPKMMEKSKVVYLARDPRDVIISLYHYARLHILWGFTGTLEEFVDDFLNDRILYGPYWSHLKENWENRDHPNFCFVFYEDLKNDIFSEVKRLSKFFGISRTDEEIQNVAHHSSFAKMKERTKDNPPSSNFYAYFNKNVLDEQGGFFRKGVVGDWKNSFTPEQVKKINVWMANNLPQFGKNFKYKV